MFRSAVHFALVASVAGHGAMLSPRPRSSHNQTFDEHNRCGASEPYSTTGLNPGEYCGLGCLGDSCLYYQIGCFQSCGTCSLEGKTLYPVPEDLIKAGNCKPQAPTLGGGDKSEEKRLRTYNIDNDSAEGDWTAVMPWRAPGTAGRGNTKFQPCGINSGADVRFNLPPTTARDVPLAGNGTQLPRLSRSAESSWRAGDVVEAEWAIYANHGGGYSYRLCKKEEGKAITEECFQRTPLKFASERTHIRHYDTSKPEITIPATTTSVGTWPQGSEWRKNPIPMCNCDMGTGCSQKQAGQVEQLKEQEQEHFEADGGCSTVPPQKCGTKFSNSCLKCGNSSAYDCEECCEGCSLVSKGEYKYCSCSGPKPSNTQYSPYNQTYLTPDQHTPHCPTGLMFPSSFDEGYGNGNLGTGYGEFEWSMVDMLQVPEDLEPGEYVLSWRWDCEQTPQVWNSCADVGITAAAESA